MKTIETIEWPLPVWSPAKLDESRQLAASGPGTSFGAFLAQLRLTAEAGDLAAARQELGQFRTAPTERSLSAGELRQIVPVALLLQARQSASDLLASVYPTSRSVGFAVTKGAEHAVMAMRIAGPEVTFVLSDAIFRHAQNEITLQRFVDIYPILAHFLESPARVDGTVTINLGDAGSQAGLTFCGNRPGDFLIPDSIFMDSHGYASLRHHFSRNCKPWEQRSPVAFWRGSTTGMAEDPKLAWRSLPRIRLCEIGAKNLGLIDAGITKVTQIADPAAQAWIAEAGLMRDHVPAESFQDYRYQIDIDGNTTSWPGLFTKLLTGSVVLKVPPRDGYEQWYYDRLLPWINFIPLASDMSDLVDKVHWLRNHDDAARAIGEAGLRLAEDLTYEQETRRAARTVAAAIKDASGDPVVDLDFASSSDDTALLRDGWLAPETTGVASAGYQSRIDLPRPPGVGDFILRFDVSPMAPRGQNVALAINGQVIAQRRIAARAMIHLPLHRSALANNADVTLTLLYPDATHAASPASPGDPRLLGIRLHRLAILASGAIPDNPNPDLAEAVAALRRKDEANHPQDLAGPPPDNLREPLLPLQTFHGTLAYADVKTGRLRHGPADTVPRNLFLAASGGDVLLVRIMPNTRQRWTVRLRPEGQFADQADREQLGESGYAERFRIVDNDKTTFAIGAAGMVLCAEPSGDLSLARIQIGGWERFRTVTQTGQTSGTNPSDEDALVSTLKSLDADLAFLLGAVTGTRVEDQLRPIAERVRTNEAALVDILQA